MLELAPTLLANVAPRLPRLEVVTGDDHRAVFLNAHLVARYACDDRGTERVIVTQLAEVLTLQDREIAGAFDLHPVTLSRFRRQVRHGGAAALMPRPPGPSRPEQDDDAAGRPLPAARPVRPLLSDHCRAGLDARAGDLRYHGRGAGPFGPVGHVPAARGDHLWAHPMVRVGPETLAAIVCGFALRFRSIEDLKNAQRADLGVLLGTAQAPTVLVLCQKIQTLVAHALDALLGTLNREQPRLRGDGPILHFILAEPLNNEEGVQDPLT